MLQKTDRETNTDSIRSRGGNCPSRAGGYPGEWIGRFIWDDGDSLPVNCYMMFRKTFQLEEVPANALLMTTAADKYQLWVNGIYVGRGPVRTVGPQWVAYDSYQVAPMLRPGKNSVAVLVFFHGRMNGFSQDQRAGFFAQMEMTFDSLNEPAIWGTDRTWKLRLSEGWRRDTKQVNACYAAFTEVCDLGADPVDWIKTEFDDADWRAATVLSDRFGSSEDVDDKLYSPGTPPDCWSYLEPRPIPPLREVELHPQRIVRTAEAVFWEGIVPPLFPAERMMKENIRELHQAAMEGAEHLIDENGSCVVRSWVSSSASRPENLIRNHACMVYGPFGEFVPLPSSVDWRELPPRIEMGKVVREGLVASLTDGYLDLSSVGGKNFCGDNTGGTAMVLIPFHLDQTMELAIGAGADWWVQLFYDGQPIIDTIGEMDEHGKPKGKGNPGWLPTPIDLQKKMLIEAGNHLLAVRFMSGSASSLLALSLLPADLPESVADPVIILDFGRPVFAAPVITFDAPAGVVVDAGYGMNLTDGRVATVHLNTRHADRCISRAGRQTWHPFRPLTVFRYLQLVFRTNGAPVTIEAVKAVTLEYPVEERGSFACSDPVLGKLWKAGVDTVFLNLEDTLICDAIRERALYMLVGELEQHHLAAASAWGKIALTDSHFLQTMRGQNRDGTLPQMLIGCANLPQNGFPALRLPMARANQQTISNYSVFYAQAVLRRHQMFPSIEFLEEQFPALIRLADWCEKHTQKDTGLLYHLPKWRWLDWLKNDLKGAHLGTNALYYKMLVDMAEIAHILELPRYERKWRGAAARVGNSIRKLHWNKERGMFVDSVFQGRQSAIFTELSNALTLLYGIAAAEQTRRVQANLVEPPQDLARVTPLYFHYVIEALLALGESDYAWRYLSLRWAPAMNEMDYPLLTEEWDWQRASGCHAGGAGVVWTLSTHALGVYPLEPGHHRVRIAPKTGALTWAKGVVPADCGDIHVEWQRDDKKITLKAIIPHGIETEIVLPCGNPKRADVTHNGRSVKSTKILRTGFGAGISVRGGKHIVCVTNEEGT